MTTTQEKGTQLLLALNSLLRTVQIHDDSNLQSVESASNVINAVRSFYDDGNEKLAMQISSGRFFLGEEKILQGKDTTSIIQIMLDYFQKRQISGLTFLPDTISINLTDILSFARLMNQAVEKDDPALWLKQMIQEKRLFWVELFEPGEQSVDFDADSGPVESSDKENKGDKAKRAYAFGLSNLKEVARKLGSGQKAGISKSVRLVQSLVNLLKDDESVLLGLSTLRIYDDVTYCHSINVALLSMCIGKRIGLSRCALESLGLSGLFHDLGKLAIPLAIMKKPAKLTKVEENVLRAHSVHGVRQVISLHAPHHRKSQLVFPAFEHHMKLDLTGYPKISNWRLSLFSRIIAIADFFDAITSPRVYRDSFLSPDQAISDMMMRSGKDFDPILLKVFIGMLGFYPPGTFVELDSGEIGIVLDTPQDNRDKGLPRVILLKKDADKGYKKGETVDLAEKSTETGIFLRQIINTAHPAAYNIQPAQYLI